MDYIFASLQFLGISFTPKEIGEHLVSVKKRGRHVPNSPFRIMVGESEIADASKVKVYGDGCEKAVAGETAEFKVDTRKAGKMQHKILYSGTFVCGLVKSSRINEKHQGL